MMPCISPKICTVYWKETVGNPTFVLRKFYKINPKLLSKNPPKPEKGLVWF